MTSLMMKSYKCDFCNRECTFRVIPPDEAAIRNKLPFSYSNLGPSGDLDRCVKCQKICCQECSRNAGFSCPSCGGREWEIAFRKDIILAVVAGNPDRHKDPAIHRYLNILEKPSWMFWVDRTPAFQALGDYGDKADDSIVNGLARILCSSLAKKKWKMEASVALLRIGQPAISTIPILRQAFVQLSSKNKREDANIVLATIKGIGGVETLGELLCEPACSWVTKAVVAHELDKIDATPALKSLIRFLEANDHGDTNWALKDMTFSPVVKAIGRAIGMRLDNRYPYTQYWPAEDPLNDIAKDVAKALVGIIKNPSHFHPKSGIPLEILILLQAMYPTCKSSMDSGETPARWINNFVQWWSESASPR
ncbi:MAG: hypothetical protein EOM12_15445 [Verrucomicrobiae bacterium]|nr:hypothetical protein [Verrucomicrobiae bacterium]